MPRNPRNHSQNQKKKKKIHSLLIPKKVRESSGLLKARSTKFGDQKKRHVVRKCSLCSESFTSQKELNDHVAAVHNYKFLCSDRKCGKAFGSLESLRKHKLHHRNMKFLCNVCGEKYPFTSDLSSHQALHSQDKKYHCTYSKCGRKYQKKVELNRHYNYRHKQKSSKATIDKCVMNM